MTANITYTQLIDGRYEARIQSQSTIAFMGVTVWHEYFDSFDELKFKYPTAQPKNQQPKRG